MPSRHDDEPDVRPWMISVGRLFGLTEVQARWRAMKILRSLSTTKRELAPPSSRVPSKLCPHCRALQRSTDRLCTSCGGKMTSPFTETLRRVGVTIPPIVSVSSLLAAAMLLLYVRAWVKFPHEAFGGWSGEHLVAMGSNFGPLTQHGEYFRLATAVFLHIGVMHIAFNLMALAQVGPAIEQIFGRGRMLFYFMVTGIAASAASAYLQVANSAGASGAIMGLIGIAAGWGHRMGTPQGKNIRDQMLKWGLYTVGFGFIINADNYAHGAGFVAGALIGYAHSPASLDPARSRGASTILGALGVLGAVATVVVIMLRIPQAATHTATDDRALADDDNDSPEHTKRVYAELFRQCEEPGNLDSSSRDGRAQLCKRVLELRDQCAAIRAGRTPDDVDPANLAALKAQCEELP